MDRSTDVQFLLRSNFEDVSHGADTQCSVILENLHTIARKAGRLPLEFLVGADNTVKETKNTCFIAFSMWLLCVLDDSCLWSIVFFSLLVGHTHDPLDRFFALLKLALHGRDYMTLAQLMQIVLAALNSRNDIFFEHVTQTWGWTQMAADLDLPRVHGHDLPRIHVFNIFRSNGIWIKWKQYMSDDAWSRPVLLLGPGGWQRLQ